MSDKAWGGRFEEELDAIAARFSASVDVDGRLWPQDIDGSVAHVRMLADRNVLSKDDAALIESGLHKIRASIEAGQFDWDAAKEDVHMNIEARLIERIGDVGKKLHTGRSRNDQVLAALRLYLKDACKALHDGAMHVAVELDALAARESETPLPGYTHLQPAMPSSVKLWAGGYAAEIRDDAEGLLAARRRLDRNPLGSAAGYGVPILPIDREHTRESPGFAQTHEPVTAVQLSRGKAESQLVFEIHLLMQDMGRMAADLILFCSQEFSYVALPGSMTTGSSIMPQKRNPDVFELVRGRTATAQACLVEVLGITAKLPSGYQRDLQLIKAPLFRSIDLCGETLDIMAAAIPNVRFSPGRIRLEPDIHAAAEANELVAQERDGVRFQCQMQMAIVLDDVFPGRHRRERAIRLKFARRGEREQRHIVFVARATQAAHGP